MGVRGELFSNRIILPNRTYFFNVKENRMGDLYLNIVESKNRETGGFDRQSVILFADDLQEFLKGFDESLKVMEKAVREKRHSTSGHDEKNYNREKPVHDERSRENFTEGRTGQRERGRDRNRENFTGGRTGPREHSRDRRNSTGEKHSKNFKTGRSHDHKPDGGRHDNNRRVTIKKRGMH
jgi:hypothetical protein